MSEYECFAFFCEDFRTEMGGKTSYMGILGPHIDLEPMPLDAPPDIKAALSKLVITAMIRTDSREPINLKTELVFENAPDEVFTRIENEHILPVNADFEMSLAQFNAQMPNIPVRSGMKIIANFQAGSQRFGASLTMR